MDSVKGLLRIRLDDINEPHVERCPYFDGLLSQWLDIWRSYRTDPLLIYVLGERINQYRDDTLDINDLDTIDRIKTNFLEVQCSQKGICLYLAKMKSAINEDPDDPLQLKMAISLHGIRDLNGGLLVNKPVAVTPESIIQIEQSIKERYHGTVSSDTVANPYPSPSGGSPTLRNNPSGGSSTLRNDPLGRSLTLQNDPSRELSTLRNDLSGQSPTFRNGSSGGSPTLQNYTAKGSQDWVSFI